MIIFISLFTFLINLYSPKIDSQEEYIYIGTFSERGSKGIYVYAFDRGEEALNLVQTVTGKESPSFLTIHPSGKYLYSVNREGLNEHPEWGSVNAYSINPGTGKLSFLNAKSSMGAGPCHVSMDHNGQWLFVSNYRGGNLSVYSVMLEGYIGERKDVVQHYGSSVNKQRQEQPHIHSIHPCPHSHYILAADLGIDELKEYELEPVTGKLNPTGYPIEIKPGSGPRHFAFHPGTNNVYIAEELSSTVSVYAFTPEEKKELIQRVSTLPEDFKDENTCADIHFDPEGRHLYVSNRGHNSLAIYSVDEESGRLSLIDHQSTLGERPRNFMIGTKGEYVFVANRNSDNVVLFKRDRSTGMLKDTGTKINVPSPVCIKMLSRNIQVK